MPDTTYGPKVYRKQGGDELVVASGGEHSVESGGAIRLESGAKLLDEQAAGGSQPAVLFHHDIDVPATTSTGALDVDLTVADKVEIIDVTALKVGGGASAATVCTFQVTTSTNGAITDAMDLKKVDKTIVRAGTIDDALNTIAAGGVIRVKRAGSIDGGAGAVNSARIRVTAVKRS